MKNSAGVGFLEILGIVFVILKLCKVIAWPWVWVLSPFWIEIIIAGIALILWFRE